MSTACVIVIGNEILSGRTQDTNLNWLAKQLNDMGIRLLEARVVPDVPEAIIEAVNICRARYDYLFTTGGIGPTHDDITSECIARAFGVAYERNRDAEELLMQHYGKEKLNAARLKMCDMPEGATLIINPVSIAPGYRIGNVYVMAGVPGVMKAMFDGIRSELKGGLPIRSISVGTYLTEGVIAAELGQIQKNFPAVDIGSYPFMRDGRLGTSLVARSTDTSLLSQVSSALQAMIFDLGGVSFTGE